jgi:SAM-dependent methyltransferase
VRAAIDCSLNASLDVGPGGRAGRGRSRCPQQARDERRRRDLRASASEVQNAAHRDLSGPVATGTVIGMDYEAKLGRLLIGLRGLGLLREWPFGDPSRAEEQLRTIAEMVARRGSPPMNEALDLGGYDYADGYSAWAETYDDPGNALLDVEEPLLRSILAGVPLGDAVDVACGTGRITAMLCEQGHRVTGVDPSEVMLDRARSKGLPATFIVGSFDRLPVDDNSADLVTCGLALTHVTHLRPAIGEIARVLRPGGRVVLTDVHPIAVATGAQALFRRADGSRGVMVNHQHWVSDYVAAFVEAGLTIERCDEPVVDEGFIAGLGSEDVRAAADLGISGLPLLLFWQLRSGFAD